MSGCPAGRSFAAKIFATTLLDDATRLFLIAAALLLGGPLSAEEKSAFACVLLDQFDPLEFAGKCQGRQPVDQGRDLERTLRIAHGPTPEHAGLGGRARPILRGAGIRDLRAGLHDAAPKVSRDGQVDSGLTRKAQRSRP